MSNPNIFDQETLESLQYLKYENPLTAPILQKHDISIAIVLGTGLGPFIDALKGKVSVSYNDIPHMPKPTIQGHFGHIVIGYVDKDSNSESSNDENELSTNEDGRLYCIAYAGRVHSYEGISNHEVCYQVKLSAALGCKQYILTNSTGGLQNGMYDGCLFLIKDHMRLIGRTDPLFEMRYASQWKAQRTDRYWDEDLQKIARRCAERLQIELFEGTYVYASGPNYETPLEVRTAISLGGGVVGMSTVSETIAANAYGMRVLGISMVTNLGAGISTKMLSHEEVQENAALAIPRFINILKEITKEINNFKDELVSTFEPKICEKVLQRRNLDSEHVKENIELSTAFIKKALELDNKYASTLIISTDRYLSSSLKNVKQLPLRDIPHFPVISISANVGAITIGDLPSSNKRVIVLVSENKEGFLEEESAYIAILAYKLGIISVVHSLQGEYLGQDSNLFKSIIHVDDVLNFSCCTRPLAILKNIFEHPLSNIEKESLFINSTKSNQNIYISFQAPSYASLHEKQMAIKYGATIIGKTNIAPLYAFRYLGLKAQAIFTPMEASEEIQNHYFNELSLSVSNEPLDLNRPELPYRSTPLDFPFISVPAEKNISYLGVVETAKYISTTFINDLNVKYGLIDLELNLQWPNFIVKTLPIRNIPYLSTYFRSNVLKASDLNLLKIHSSYVLAVCGCFDGNDPFYIADASIFVRIFQELNIRGIIFTGTLRAADSNLSPKNVYSIKDHINFSGENPLIGRNVPEWGPRFPDATTSYSLMFDVPEGVTKTIVNGLFTGTSRQLRLVSENQLAKNLNCDVIGNLGIRELITSVHCMINARIRAGYLGLLEDYQSVTDSNPVLDLQNIILHFFEKNTE